MMFCVICVGGAGCEPRTAPFGIFAPSCCSFSNWSMSVGCFFRHRNAVLMLSERVSSGKDDVVAGLA